MVGPLKHLPCDQPSPENYAIRGEIIDKVKCEVDSVYSFAIKSIKTIRQVSVFAAV
jgi:hypothetical protein